MKLCIIFSHHYVNDVIKYRFGKLKELNPNASVVSVGLSGYELLPNSIIIDRNLWPNNNKLTNPFVLDCPDWSTGDLCIYQSFLENPNFDYYFLIEYDTAFNVPVLDFFNINTEYAGNCGRNYDIKQLYWYTNYKSQSFNYKEFKHNELATTGPTTCLWFSNNLLKKITTELMLNKNRYNNMFSELRLGTLVNQFTNIRATKPCINKLISWKHELVEEVEGKFFYHPRKKLISNEM